MGDGKVSAGFSSFEISLESMKRFQEVLEILESSGEVLEKNLMGIS